MPFLFFKFLHNECCDLYEILHLSSKESNKLPKQMRAQGKNARACEDMCAQAFTSHAHMCFCLVRAGVSTDLLKFFR